MKITSCKNYQDLAVFLDICLQHIYVFVMLVYLVTASFYLLVLSHLPVEGLHVSPFLALLFFAILAGYWKYEPEVLEVYSEYPRAAIFYFLYLPPLMLWGTVWTAWMLWAPTDLPTLRIVPDTLVRWVTGLIPSIDNFAVESVAPRVVKEYMVLMWLSVPLQIWALFRVRRLGLGHYYFDLKPVSGFATRQEAWCQLGSALSAWLVLIWIAGLPFYAQYPVFLWKQASRIEIALVGSIEAGGYWSIVLFLICMMSHRLWRIVSLMRSEIHG